MDCVVTYWQIRINGQTKQWQINYWKFMCMTLCFLVESKIDTFLKVTLYKTYPLENTRN